MRFNCATRRFDGVRCCTHVLLLIRGLWFELCALFLPVRAHMWRFARHGVMVNVGLAHENQGRDDHNGSVAARGSHRNVRRGLILDLARAAVDALSTEGLYKKDHRRGPPRLDRRHDDMMEAN